ncbi:1825_t:CDS:2, partial [Paraglomus brasilianum]
MKDCDGKDREECSEEGCGCTEFDPVDSGKMVCLCSHRAAKHNKVAAAAKPFFGRIAKPTQGGDG